MFLKKGIFQNVTIDVRIMNKKLCSIGIITFLICVGLSGCSNKNELLNGPLYVGYGSDANFQKIQEAIDAAKNGATIIVQKGSYNELINISKTISLIGEDRNTTIINFNQNYLVSPEPIININADNCTIQNIHITVVNSSLLVLGVSLHSKYNIIKNNIITNCTNGLILSTNSELNTIAYNEIKDNQIGIYATSSTHNNVSHNIFSNNSQYNIYLILSSNTNIISFNIIKNSFYGIRIKESQDNKVDTNCIKNNDVGIYFCCGSKSNYVYNNIFINNFQGNAEEDKGLTNIWYNPAGNAGNYWDNYTGSDENHDGIGDTPYRIPREENQDNYPLLAPPFDFPCN